jgi:hypothetical protein
MKRNKNLQLSLEVSPAICGVSLVVSLVHMAVAFQAHALVLAVWAVLVVSLLVVALVISLMKAHISSIDCRAK